MAITHEQRLSVVNKIKEALDSYLKLSGAPIIQRAQPACEAANLMELILRDVGVRP